MQRKILIIDDHDDLTTALETDFQSRQYDVCTTENCADALKIGDLTAFDLIISDLDSDADACFDNIAEDVLNRLPDFIETSGGKNSAAPTIKNFKLCARKFRRPAANEKELQNLIETTLKYKIQHVDSDKKVREMHERIEFVLPSAISPMHSVLNYLLARTEKMGIINLEESNLFIALDEAFVNAVKHGNKFDTAKMVKIRADISPEEARFVVEDEGEGFDVKQIPDPLHDSNLYKTSGRGVLLIQSLMDEVRYNERGNRIEMVKRST